MKQEGLMYFTDTYLTSLGLTIFFVFFIGVCFWVYRKGSQSLYTQLSQLPLQNGDDL